jgi:hypothetical protein
MSTNYHCLTCEELYTQVEFEEGIKWCSMCCQKDPKIISEYELEARQEDPETYAEIDRAEEEREAKKAKKKTAVKNLQSVMESKVKRKVQLTDEITEKKAELLTVTDNKTGYYKGLEINKLPSGTIQVLDNGEQVKNTKKALKAIAEGLKLEFDFSKINTRSLGSRLIKHLSK